MGKIVNLKQAEKLVKQFKNTGKSVVLAGGCFDILHQGHITYLEEAKRQGDVLFVALESDRNVKHLKGSDRPRTSQKKRAENLLATAYVDYIVLLQPITDDENYFNLTKNLLPHIIAVTEGDPKQVEKERQAKAVGGKVVVVTKKIPNYSTTQLLKEL